MANVPAVDNCPRQAEASDDDYIYSFGLTQSSPQLRFPMVAPELLQQFMQSPNARVRPPPPSDRRTARRVPKQKKIFAPSVDRYASAGLHRPGCNININAMCYFSRFLSFFPLAFLPVSLAELASLSRNRGRACNFPSMTTSTMCFFFERTTGQWLPVNTAPFANVLVKPIKLIFRWTRPRRAETPV